MARGTVRTNKIAVADPLWQAHRYKHPITLHFILISIHTSKSKAHR